MNKINMPTPIYVALGSSVKELEVHLRQGASRSKSVLPGSGCSEVGVNPTMRGLPKGTIKEDNT